MYQMLATVPEFETTDYSHVRHAVCAGGIAAPALLERWAARGAPLEPQFGGTETGPTVLMLDCHDLEHALVGSVGRPIHHTEVRLVDPVTGEDVADGEVGELWVRGPSITPGYWQRPNEEFFTDGFLLTGDALHRDAEGYFFYSGRFKDMYKSGGENVYAAEVEAVLQTVPGVAEVAIIGIPDPHWHEVGLAIVVATPGADVTLEHPEGRLRGPAGALQGAQAPGAGRCAPPQRDRQGGQGRAEEGLCRRLTPHRRSTSTTTPPTSRRPGAIS